MFEEAKRIQNSFLSKPNPLFKMTTNLPPEAYEKDPMTPMLHRAHHLINGIRASEYGNALTNFQHIADLWTAYTQNKFKFSAEDVALMMMQVKIARLAKSPEHEDSILDVAGYAGCYDKILTLKKAQKENT